MVTDGPGPLTNSTAHWFWNDAAATDETVTCTAIVTPNDGKNAPYTVNVTQKVSVQVPDWTASGAGGYMQINYACPNGNQKACLYAGPAPVAGESGGMNWTATSTTPQVPVAFGTGTVELVQLVTPTASYTTYPKPIVLHTDPEKTEGLDTKYPYAQLPGTPPYAEGGSPFATNDNPLLNLEYYHAGQATMTDSFTDYLLYQPPGADVRWVPLANFMWSTSGSATIPRSGLWGDYTVKGTPYDVPGAPFDKAGTVTPSTNPPTNKKFAAYNTHPSWTLINSFPDDY